MLIRQIDILIRENIYTLCTYLQMSPLPAKHPVQHFRRTAVQSSPIIFVVSWIRVSVRLTRVVFHYCRQLRMGTAEAISALLYQLTLQPICCYCTPITILSAARCSWRSCFCCFLAILQFNLTVQFFFIYRGIMNY